MRDRYAHTDGLGCADVLNSPILLRYVMYDARGRPLPASKSIRGRARTDDPVACGAKRPRLAPDVRETATRQPKGSMGRARRFMIDPGATRLPRVHVVMCTYEPSADYFLPQVDSILTQQSVDISLAVFDDGSSDFGRQ